MSLLGAPRSAADLCETNADKSAVGESAVEATSCWPIIGRTPSRDISPQGLRTARFLDGSHHSTPAPQKPLGESARSTAGHCGSVPRRNLEHARRLCLSLAATLNRVFVGPGFVGGVFGKTWSDQVAILSF